MQRGQLSRLAQAIVRISFHIHGQRLGSERNLPTLLHCHQVLFLQQRLFQHRSKKMTQEIMQQALDARIAEVAAYQLNITNYELALRHIAQLSPAERVEVDEFKSQLEHLLMTERREQKKADIMRIVLAQQMDALALSR